MRREFRVKLDGDPTGKMDTASFTLPFNTKPVWGKSRVPVRGTINGFEFRSTVACMGGEQFIVVNAKVRAGAGVKAGDLVDIALEPDTAPREIEIPAAMKKALGVKPAAALGKLAYTHKKEFVQWFLEAKKEETRDRRVAKMKEMLASGKTIS